MSTQWKRVAAYHFVEQAGTIVGVDDERKIVGGILTDMDAVCRQLLKGAQALARVEELQAALDEHHGNLLGVTRERDELAAKLAEAESQFAALRNDMERLDWIRANIGTNAIIYPPGSHGGENWCLWMRKSDVWHEGESFYAAIDAARKAKS